MRRPPNEQGWQQRPFSDVPPAVSINDSRLQTRLSCGQKLTSPSDATRSVDLADIDALIASLGLAIERSLQRRRQAGIDPAEQINCRRVVTIIRSFTKRVTGDRVSSRDRGVNSARRYNIRGIEQFRRLKKLTSVDKSLSGLLHVAGLTAPLAPAHR
jgi:hypothetical protein